MPKTKARHKELSGQTLERQAADTIVFFQQVDRHRGFEAIPINNLQLSVSEVCVFTADARLRQVRAHGYSVGGSVRVMKGVYVGQRQYQSTESFDVVNTGVLYVTNTRLIFTGLKSTLNTPFNKLVSLDMHTDGLFVHSSGRQKASFIEFSGSLIVSMIVKYFQKNGSGVRLREDEHIVAYYDEQRQTIIVSRRDANDQPAALPALQDESAPLMLPESDEVAVTKPQPEAPNLYVFPKDVVEGPFSLEQLRELLQSKTVDSATPCCEGGAAEWKTVADYV